MAQYFEQDQSGVARHQLWGIRDLVQLILGYSTRPHSLRHAAPEFFGAPPAPDTPEYETHRYTFGIVNRLNELPESLYAAVLKGSRRSLEWLAAQGWVDSDVALTILRVAAERGRNVAVEWAAARLEKEPDKRDSDEALSWGLNAALKRGYASAVAILERHGARRFTPISHIYRDTSNYSDSALRYAVQSGSRRAVEHEWKLCILNLPGDQRTPLLSRMLLTAAGTKTAKVMAWICNEATGRLPDVDHVLAAFTHGRHRNYRTLVNNAGPQILVYDRLGLESCSCGWRPADWLLREAFSVAVLNKNFKAAAQLIERGEHRFGCWRDEAWEKLRHEFRYELKKTTRPTGPTQPAVAEV